MAATSASSFMKKKEKGSGTSLHFPSVPLTQANQRAGKHYRLVSDILSDVVSLDEFSAIKIDLAESGVKKARLRAAIHRAAKKKKLQVATSSDEKSLYVFRFSLKRGNSLQNLRKPT
jgi:hypothetical protein